MNAVSVDDIHHYSHIIGRHTTINDAYIPSTDLSPGPWEFYCAMLVMSSTHTVESHWQQGIVLMGGTFDMIMQRVWPDVLISHYW